MADTWEHDPHEVADDVDANADDCGNRGHYGAAATLHCAAQMLRDLWEENDQRQGDAATLYQVLGALLDETGRFDTDEGQAALDLASYLAGNRARSNSADSILPFVAADEATAIAQETGQYDEWITHDSHQPPADLAAAQLVDVEDPTRIVAVGGQAVPEVVRLRADDTNWQPYLRYRPALSANGLPLCSGEGLSSPKARYVATDTGGIVWAYPGKPYYRAVPGTWSGSALSTGPESQDFCRPGHTGQSLMEVSRD